MKWRWFYFIAGLAVMSFGVSMTIKGKEVGTAPWDVLHVGLHDKFGLSIGTWSILIGLLIVVSTSLYLKEWPKLATWLNMFLCGTFIDFFNWVLPDTNVLVLEVLYFVAGVVVMSVGCAFYIAPNLGTGPRDTIMMLIVEKFGGSIRMARFLMEIFAATLGWLLGGPIGVGTVFIALCSGYFIQAAFPFFQKLLEKRIAQSDIHSIPEIQKEALAKEL